MRTYVLYYYNKYLFALLLLIVLMFGIHALRLCLTDISIHNSDSTEQCISVVQVGNIQLSNAYTELRLMVV